MSQNIVSRAIQNAVATAGYISLVALFMSKGEKMFGPDDNFLIPLALLLLFVLSASITGGLVLGKPILLYLDNKRGDAVRLFIYTLLSLAVILIVIFGALFLAGPSGVSL
jgi:hypothetical protein